MTLPKKSLEALSKQGMALPHDCRLTIYASGSAGPFRSLKCVRDKP
jgi:hypothetical protein